MGLWITIGATTLLLTFSRLEIAATIVSIFITFMLTVQSRSKLFLRSATLILIIPIILIITPIIIFIYQQSAPEGLLASLDPRIVFFIKSLEIARDNFPFGSGLGTYGGFVAAVYDSAVYVDYGFESYYWYLQRTFLADTFWPHILGETGFLGFVFYACCPLLIIIQALRSKNTNNALETFGKMAMSLTFLITLNSLATPDMVSVLSLAQCFIPVGCLYYLGKTYAK